MIKDKKDRNTGGKVRKKRKKKKSSKTFKIGIDIDNVISDTYTALVGRVNEVFGISIQMEEVITFSYLEENLGIEKERVREFITNSLKREDFSLAIKPYEDAVSIVRKWGSYGYSIHYITARPSSLGEITQKWLEKHGFWLKGATLDLFDESIGYKSDVDYKKRIVEKIGIDVLIEDSRENAQVMDIPVLLLDMPWNRGEVPENVKRVSNWGEIEEHMQVPRQRPGGTRK